MPVGITDLAHSLRQNTAGSAAPIALSRGQQLICAALGHKSLASYQAAQAAAHEPRDLDGVAHVLPDYRLLGQRAKELGVAIPATGLRQLVDQAFEERLSHAQLHDSYGSMVEELHDEMQEVVLSDDAVNGQMANANYDGVDEVYFEPAQEPAEAPLSEPLSIAVSGQVTLGIDTERPYSGHQVMVKVGVTMQRLGRRCLGEPEIEVLAAALDQDWSDREDDEPRPRRSLAQALAEELNIDVVEAEQLTDAEPEALTGNSDEMTYSYLFDFTRHASPALAAKLMKLHGSLQLEVAPWFFDAVEPPVGPG
jgi:hypothetical protein